MSDPFTHHRRRPARRRLSVLVALLVMALAGVGSATNAAAASIIRFQGADRFATSAAIVQANYQPGVPVAYIATGLNFPDALAGGAAAAKAGGPLLLVLPNSIPTPIASELTRLTPASIVVLGGVSAVSDGVLTTLKSFTTGSVTRVSGADRYSTAANLASSFPAGSPVFIATGQAFPDALAGTAAAAAKHAAILLTGPNTLPSATAAALSKLAPSSITILGGTGAVSGAVATQLNTYSSNVTRLAGSDRYATAAAIATSAFPAATGVFITTGAGFADALTGGPVAGAAGQPLLLATVTCLPAATAAVVTADAPATVTLLGGTGVLGAGVASLTSCAVPVPPAPTGITFGDGIHQIGASLPAGTYRTRANVSGCYWARLSGFSGQLSDIIANNFTSSHQVVAIEPTDAGFSSSGCGTWTSNLSPLTTSQTAPFGDGTFIVGTDISAGAWGAAGGSSCYWARESGFSGSLSDVIANDFGGITPIVTISASDAGFSSSGCGTWTKQ